MSDAMVEAVLGHHWLLDHSMEQVQEPDILQIPDIQQDLAHDDAGLGYQGIQVNIGWSKSEDHHNDIRGRVLDLNYT